MERVILHCDMNNFYASVEIKLNPHLKGKALAVGGSNKDRHGIVLAKSYEAKIKGVKTGESLMEARKKCPELLVVPPHFEEYILISKKAREIYYSYTDKVEPYGIDECWLDMTGTEGIFGSPLKVAEKIKEEIKSKLGVSISVGISFNKIFAKLGSDLADRDSIINISKGSFKDIVWPLPVIHLLGVGYRTQKKLNWYGIYTIGDIAASGEDFMARKFGINGSRLFRYARGLDTAPIRGYLDVVPPKSIGHGVTLISDALNEKEVFMVLLELSIDVAYRLNRLSLKAKRVEIGIRDSSLKYYTFQGPLPFPSAAPLVLAESGIKLFKDKYGWERNVRLVSIRAIDLVPLGSSEQLDLLGDFKFRDKQEAIAKVLVGLRERFGRDTLTYGVLLKDLKVSKNRNLVSVLPRAMER